MKLNQYQKDAVVAAIFQDVPTPNRDEIESAIQAEIVKGMSPDVRRVYRKAPNALARGESHCGIFDRRSVRFIVGDADEKSIIAPWQEQRKKYDDAKNALRNVINACSTLKQLQDRLPEFAAYFPTEDKPTPNLPAIANMVTTMMQLGWNPKKVTAV